MRIALLSSDWKPTGGVTTYVRSLAGVLSRTGHDVRVVHGDAGATAEAAAGFEIVAAPGALFAAAAGDSRLSQPVVTALDAFAPDIVHVQSNNNFPLEDAIRARWPVVKTFHVHEYCPAGTKYHFGPERACGVRTGLMCVPRMGYLRCTLSRRPNVIWSLYRHTMAANRHHRTFRHIIVCSEHLKRQAVFTGFDEERVNVVPYFTESIHDAIPGPEGPGLHVTDGVPDLTRGAPDLQVRGPEILFVGRLVRSKGADLLLDALTRLTSEWNAVIVGNGPELEPLRKRAQALNVAGRVSFPGWLTGSALSDAYARAAVVVVPSRWPEPFGIVGLEAMAHGRVVVAFNVGGIPEWLEEGVGGTLVPAGDVAALAERIGWMLDHPDDARRLAALGHARVASDFSPAAHLARLLPVYERARAAA